MKSLVRRTLYKFKPTRQALSTAALGLARQLAEQGVTPSNIKDYFKPRRSNGRPESSKTGEKRKRERSSKEDSRESKKSKREDKKQMPRGNFRTRYPARSGRNPRFTKPTKRASRGKKKKKFVIVTKKQVKKWNKASLNAKIDLSKHREYHRFVGQITCSHKQSVFAQAYGLSVLGLEAFLDTLVFADTSVDPVGIKTSNIVSSTTAQKIQVEVGTFTRWANNFAVPIWLDVYLFVPKGDTDDTPTSLFVDGLVPIGSVTVNSVFVHPSWSENLKSIYEMANHKKVCLAPGESVSLSFKKKFRYDPTDNNIVPENYRRKYGSHFYNARIEGVVGHGHDVNADICSSAASIDFHTDVKVKVIYDGGGMKFNRIKVEDNSATNQAGGTVVGWSGNAANTIGTQVDA